MPDTSNMRVKTLRASSKMPSSESPAIWVISPTEAASSELSDLLLGAGACASCNAAMSTHWDDIDDMQCSDSGLIVCCAV